MGACISHTWPWSQPFPSRSIYRTPPSVRRTNQNRAIRSMSRRVKIAHPLVAKVKKRIWPVKRPRATAVKGENQQTKCCHDYEFLTASKEKQSYQFFHGKKAF